MRSKVLEICLNFKSFLVNVYCCEFLEPWRNLYFISVSVMLRHRTHLLAWFWHDTEQWNPVKCFQQLAVILMNGWHYEVFKICLSPLQGWTIVPSPLWLVPTVILSQVHNCFTLLCQSHVHIKSCCLIKYCILYIFVYIIYISSLLFYRMEDWPRRHT